MKEILNQQNKTELSHHTAEKNLTDLKGRVDINLN